MEDCKKECKKGKTKKFRGGSKQDSKSKQAPKSKQQAPPKTESNSSNSRPILEFPHILRIIGPKHIKIAMQFVPSAIIYSVTSLILVTYMSEWKTVLQYLPYYNGKYYVESRDKKQDKEEQEET